MADLSVNSGESVSCQFYEFDMKICMYVFMYILNIFYELNCVWLKKLMFLNKEGILIHQPHSIKKISREVGSVK